MAQRIRALRRTGTGSARAAIDTFLSSPRCTNPNTRRAYAGALDRVLHELGADVELAQLSGDQLAEVLQWLWGQRAPAA
jgi:hypothetical protein